MIKCYVVTARDVDDIHDMMDDISEQNEIAEEISGALSAPVGFASEIDDVSCCLLFFDGNNSHKFVTSSAPAMSAFQFDCGRSWET